MNSGESGQTHRPSSGADDSAPASDMPSTLLSPQQLSDEIARLAQMNRYEDAAELAKALLRHRPQHRRALRVLTRLGQGDESVISGWRILAEENHADPEPHLQLARLFSRFGNDADAREAIDVLLAIDPSNSEGMELRFKLAISERSAADVIACYRDLHSTSSTRAEQAIGRAITAFEDQDRYLLPVLLGVANATESLSIEHRTLFETMRVKALSRAYTAEVAGDDRDAGLQFWTLAQLLPEEAEYRQGLERALKRLIATARRGTSASVNAARTLAQIHPLWAEAHLILARAAAATRSWTDAAAHFDRYHAVARDQKDHLLEYCEAAARAGRVERAISVLEALVSPDRPRSVAIDQVEGLLIGLVAGEFESKVSAGDLRGALESISRLERLGTDVAALRKRVSAQVSAFLRDSTGRDAAEQIRLLALRHRAEPGSAAIATKLGRELMKARRYREAADVWSSLTRTAPADVEPWLQLARAERKLGREDAARSAASKVLMLDPEHAEAKLLQSS